MFFLFKTLVMCSMAKISLNAPYFKAQSWLLWATRLSLIKFIRGAISYPLSFCKPAVIFFYPSPETSQSHESLGTVVQHLANEGRIRQFHNKPMTYVHIHNIIMCVALLLQSENVPGQWFSCERLLDQHHRHHVTPSWKCTSLTY